MARKTAGRGEESRRRILEETLALAAERGYHGTTVALVAERSGLPVSSIYWHFGNKDELLAEALMHGFDEWRAGLPTAAALDKPSLGEAVRSRFRLGARLLAENRPYVRFGTLLLLERGLSEAAARRRYLDVYLSLRSTLLDWWKGMLPGPLADDGWAEHLTAVHLAFMEGLQVGILVDGWDGERLAQRVADGLVDHVRRLGSAGQR